MSTVNLTESELLENLKKECDMYDLNYNHKSTVESLTKKLRAFKEASAEGYLEINKAPTTSETEAKKRENLIKKAKKLVRVEVTANDPKASVRGQVFRAVSNKHLSLRKVVPLDVPTHVPQLILNNMRESRFLTFIKKKVNGGETAVPKEIPTYNIRELPPLTPEQFNRIAVRQQADKAINDD
jgi:hypothetical protein